MNYRFDDEDICENCPYNESMYRQFPPRPPQGRPPFTGGFPQGPGGFPPGPGGPQGFGPPSGPPPSGVPLQTQSVGTLAVSPGTISPCRFRYVYIWLRNGRSFWAWLVFVDRRSVAGWRWTGRNWVYFGMDLRRIDNFVCF